MDELNKVETYLRRLFGNQAIRVKAMRKKETAEVLIGEEAIGILHRDDEDGELSFHFTMTILEVDFDA